MMMKCYVIDTSGQHGHTEVEDDWLDECQKLIDTDIVERAYRPIGDKFYNIIVDESGKCKENATMTALGYHNGELVEDLVGVLVIFNEGFRGDCESLTDDDIANIRKHIREDGVLIFGNND